MASSSGATSIAFRKANLKLEVTPQITPEGSVSLDLDVTKDSVGQATAAGFAINTKHIKTQVLVENGGTVVIGGILKSMKTKAKPKCHFSVTYQESAIYSKPASARPTNKKCWYLLPLRWSASALSCARSKEGQGCPIMHFLACIGSRAFNQ